MPKSLDHFETDLAGRLGHLIEGWPARKRQVAAEVLADLVGAIQQDLAAEDVAEQEPARLPRPPAGICAGVSV
jgi:hypothetical protein